MKTVVLAKIEQQITPEEVTERQIVIFTFSSRIHKISQCPSDKKWYWLALNNSKNFCGWYTEETTGFADIASAIRRALNWIKDENNDGEIRVFDNLQDFKEWFVTYEPGN
jgi:hypothetical protein